MKKTIISSVLLMTIGIIAGVFLVSSIDSNLVSNFFAQSNIDGATKAPVAMSNQAVVISDAFVNTSQAVVPTVVSLSVKTSMKNSMGGNGRFKDFFKFFGQPKDGEQDEEVYRSQGFGSGVIISRDGYIVTNNHVVENAIKNGITVTTNDKKEFIAKVIGRDPLTDLAVIKIEAKDLTPSHFAEMPDVKVGQFVLAVGNPLGLTSTVTSGIVSAIGRGYMGGRKNRYSVQNYIQTDAAINPGNSGGGLFNLSGSLVGINTAIATETGTYIGYGFAIPIDMVKAVVNDIIEDGKVNRGYIGVQISNLDEVMAKSLGLKEVKGVLISGILEESPAEKAGIESGDVILSIDGVSLASSNELQSQIVFKRAGDNVELTLWRNGKKIHKTVKLEAKDDEESVVKHEEEKEVEEKSEGPIEFEKLGFKINTLTKEMKKELKVKSGVLVEEVKRYSIASERGLYPGGVIIKANHKKINSPKQLKNIINSKNAGEAVLLQVKYKSTNHFVAIEIPE